MDGEIALSDREFARIKARVYADAGISPQRSQAHPRRFAPRQAAARARLGSFDAYLDFLERDGSAADAQDFVNALTTNLTRFYREEHHFTHLSGYVGELMAKRPQPGSDGKPKLRIWSAGCSTGQEPYTIALSLLAAIPISSAGISDPRHRYRYQCRRQGGDRGLSRKRTQRAELPSGRGCSSGPGNGTSASRRRRATAFRSSRSTSWRRGR
jgi:hypothetical protein